jgi:transcriptional regulator with XRE-family HTH domain
MEPGTGMITDQQLLSGLAEAVVTRRIQLNVPQDELCKRCGLNRSMLVRLEHGLLDIDVQSLHRIASALDCSVHELLESAQTNG